MAEKTIGSVVWLDLTSARYPWWPAKVEKDDSSGFVMYITFQDNVRYASNTKIRKYNCPGQADMIAQGKRKLRKRKTDLESYHSAIMEAEEYLKTNKDPHCTSSQSLNSSLDSPRTTDKLMVRLQEDSGTFTLGLDSSGQEEPCSEGAVDQNLTPGNSRDLKKDSRGTKRRKKRNLTDMNGRNDSSKGKRARLGCEMVRASEEGGKVGEGDEERGEGRKGGEMEGEGRGEVVEGEGEGVRTGEEGGEVVRETQLSCSEDATEADASQVQDIPFSFSSQLPRGETSQHSDDELELEVSSDDDLPNFNLSFTNDRPDLQPKTVVWAKYGASPHWPALVTSVKKKKNKLIPSVYFFGYNDMFPIKICKRQNVSSFASKHWEEYRNTGLNDKSKVEFNQAFNEAREFVLDCKDGKYNDTSPKDAFQEVISCRPKSFVERKVQVTQTVLTKRSPELSNEEEESEAGSPEPSRVLGRASSSSSSGSEAEESEEESEGSSPYTYERVVAEIKLLEPVLRGITSGEVESDLHRIYMSGNTKEQQKLMVGEKCGPIKHWPTKKVTTLLNEVLLKMVDGHLHLGLRYALDVLLPEMMVRVKAQVENISIEEALQNF